MEKKHQNKIKQKCDIHGIVPKSNRKNVEKNKIDTTSTHGHDLPLSGSVLLRQGLYFTNQDCELLKYF